MPTFRPPFAAAMDRATRARAKRRVVRIVESARRQRRQYPDHHDLLLSVMQCDLCLRLFDEDDRFRGEYHCRMCKESQKSIGWQGSAATETASRKKAATDSSIIKTSVAGPSGIVPRIDASAEDRASGDAEAEGDAATDLETEKAESDKKQEKAEKAEAESGGEEDTYHGYVCVAPSALTETKYVGSSVVKHLEVGDKLDGAPGMEDVECPVKRIRVRTMDNIFGWVTTRSEDGNPIVVSAQRVHPTASGTAAAPDATDRRCHEPDSGGQQTRKRSPSTRLGPFGIAQGKLDKAKTRRRNSPATAVKNEEHDDIKKKTFLKRHRAEIAIPPCSIDGTEEEDTEFKEDTAAGPGKEESKDRCGEDHPSASADEDGPSTSAAATGETPDMAEQKDGNGKPMVPKGHQTQPDNKKKRRGWHADERGNPRGLCQAFQALSKKKQDDAESRGGKCRECKRCGWARKVPKAAALSASRRPEQQRCTFPVRDGPYKCASVWTTQSWARMKEVCEDNMIQYNDLVYEAYATAREVLGKPENKKQWEIFWKTHRKTLQDTINEQRMISSASSPKADRRHS